VGIYGDYGGGDDGCGGGGNDSGWNPLNLFNPLFHWCCS
jgi:hypothetical protein